MNKVKQKITGITQQAEGKIMQNSGQKIKGGLKRIQGKVNEEIADVRMRDDFDEDSLD